MIQLSKRLQAVVNYVEEKTCVADIGCDHGYCSIYLIQKGLAEKVIAMDVNAGPLKKAKENIEWYGLKDKIELRLSDGLNQLKQGEIDTILMAGMGGGLMIDLLSKGSNVVKEIQRLILQPQSEIHKVRHYLHQASLKIEKETMLWEDGKYYTVICAVPGMEQYESEVFYRYGKRLLEEKNPYLKSFLEKEERKCSNISDQIRAKGTKKSWERYQTLTNDYEYIREALEYYKEKKTENR